MKKIGNYTCRGKVGTAALGAPWRIKLFDGRFDTGYRVTRFEIAMDDQTQTNVNLHAKLATTETLVSSSGSQWNWDDNREIAWATNDHGASVDEQKKYETIDPDNLIVEDLYLYPDVNNATNYLIEMEKYEFTEWRGALAMVHNYAQNV